MHPPTVADLLADNPDYVIEKGIPRQKSIYTPSQNQTSDTFAFKWRKRDTYESAAVQRASRDWLRERYQLPSRSLEELVRGKRVLDAGCGAGHSALLLLGDLLRECRYLGVDISDAVEVAAQRFAERDLPGEFLQASLMELPAELEQFDVIFSEGVLHHTDSTEGAIRYLAQKLRTGGVFMFYVYRKKGAIREFTDDYVRQRLASLSDEEAWKALEPLSLLGKALGDLDVEIEIERPIDLLGIPAGRINLQRLFYWHIFKAYYRPDWSPEEMNHINFDWYRPQNCHRQTPEEVESWVTSCGFGILRMDVQEAGITVIAQRR